VNGIPILEDRCVGLRGDHLGVKCGRDFVAKEIHPSPVIRNGSPYPAVVRKSADDLPHDRENARIVSRIHEEPLFSIVLDWSK
jgi:hypothetical protein